MFGVIDRIEGEIAVVEFDNGLIEDISVNKIKGKILEGYVIYLKDGFYNVDLDETNKRKKEMESFLDLWD